MTEEQIIERTGRNIMWWVRKQRHEVMGQEIVWVMCPCGKRLALQQTFRCFECGLTMCNECAREHFRPRGGWRMWRYVYRTLRGF